MRIDASLRETRCKRYSGSQRRVRMGLRRLDRAARVVVRDAAAEGV
jgi:hypothetical protein